ncbi:hypothetical protein [Zobellia galactanivorans]|uniref:Uncharacterized protein n=2 Tax=Zobellia TaxID=112040 RepID=G0L1C2_ZOBGA|nr:hypothetical protein [Zobellia galactanivorans]MBU3026960.1 hypothetical protein [Zobellia galactanivorans]CAZ94600.1 Hypothetical protein ZOBELLIA_529 [Zobellia galactanivorans]
MITLIRIAFIFFIVAIGKCQTPEKTLQGVEPLTENSNFNTSAYSYPVFMDNEMHSEFLIGYEFDEKFMVELQNYYDTYRTFDVQKVSVRLKNYVSDRLYFVNGAAMERELDKHGANAPRPRYIMTNGVGYDINKNVMMEVNHDLNFNKSNIGTYGMPSLLSIKSKIKF